MRRPASPNLLPVSISSTTAIASPVLLTRTTPLPAASPSALMTSGQPSRSAAERLERDLGRFGDQEAGSRHAVPRHELLCPDLAGLDSRRRARRPENRPAGLDEPIDDADRQRQLGSDDRQGDRPPARPGPAWRPGRTARRRRPAPWRPCPRCPGRRPGGRRQAPATAGWPGRARGRRNPKSKYSRKSLNINSSRVQTGFTSSRFTGSPVRGFTGSRW